jgi:hypothetical protein
MFGGGGGFPGGMGGGGGVQIDPEMRTCSTISYPSFSLIILQCSTCSAVQVAWVEVALVEGASPFSRAVAAETPSAAAACPEVVVAGDTSILAASPSKGSYSQKLDSIMTTFIRGSSCRYYGLDLAHTLSKLILSGVGNYGCKRELSYDGRCF